MQIFLLCVFAYAIIRTTSSTDFGRRTATGSRRTWKPQSTATVCRAASSTSSSPSSGGRFSSCEPPYARDPIKEVDPPMTSEAAVCLMNERRVRSRCRPRRLNSIISPPKSGSVRDAQCAMKLCLGTSSSKPFRFASPMSARTARTCEVAAGLQVLVSRFDWPGAIAFPKRSMRRRHCSSWPRSAGLEGVEQALRRTIHD